MPPARWVYTVEYKDSQCKIDAIAALNAIEGVSAENDKNSGQLLRNVTVTVSGHADRRKIPGRILQIFGTVKKKVVLFKVTFRDSTHEKDAIKVVEALKGAGKVEFRRADSTTTQRAPAQRADSTTTNYGSNIPLPLRVPGDADPDIVLKILQKYGTAQFD